MLYHEALSADKNVAIITLTESHISDQISKDEIYVNGFQSLRADRTGRHGGGVVVYIRDDIPVTHVLQHLNNYCEYLYCFP
jgi:hypothetical protein